MVIRVVMWNELCLAVTLSLCDFCFIFFILRAWQSNSLNILSKFKIKWSTWNEWTQWNVEYLTLEQLFCRKLEWFLVDVDEIVPTILRWTNTDTTFNSLIHIIFINSRKISIQSSVFGCIYFLHSIFVLIRKHFFLRSKNKNRQMVNHTIFQLSKAITKLFSRK